MTSEDPKEIWACILETLEDTLQLGFLEEARYVTSVTRESNTLILTMQSDGAYRFFSDTSNQNRVVILAKRVSTIDSVRAMKEE